MEEHENGGAPRQRVSELQIVTIMSVPPLKVTEPRRVRKVLVSEEHRSVIHGCYQIVLYYERSREEEQDGCLAGWIVESLARVLLDYPLLAGRLQTRDDDTEGFQIVSNDSGVRLLEAHYPTTLSHFLDLNKKQHHHLEPDLVFWKEIDSQYPQFSPLFYVQVTNFDCGGYTIGISCSLLLAEVLLVENFLGKWAEIHTNISPQNEEIKRPIFYHPRLKNPESLPSDIISRSQSQNGVQSMLFKITVEDVNSSKELWRELAMRCVGEAEQKLGKNLGSGFCLVVNESSEVIKVESCSENGWSLKHEITPTTWDEFGVYEVAFNERNKPVQVSCWIDSVSDGYAMAVPLPYLKQNAFAVIVVSPPLSSQ
ncbi:Protein ECERIFERUM 2, partial [Mucuna pruriens]